MIINLVTNFTGEIGVIPRKVALYTSADFDTLTGEGFLNNASKQQGPIQPTDCILTSYNSGASFGIFTPSISSGNITLSQWNPTASGTTVVGNFANFSNTTGGLDDDGFSPTDPAKTKVVMANGAVVIGDLAIFTDTAGTVDDTPNLLTDNQQFVGLNEILINSVGTWTRTRIAEGNYVLRHTAADDTSIIGIDITEAIRTTASKGLRLASIDVIYSIGTLALDAHSIVLDQISYANDVAVAVTSVPLTGSLSTATQANPYLTNIAVTTPAFLVTANSKYVAELTVNAAITSDYDFYGLNLRFSKTVA